MDYRRPVVSVLGHVDHGKTALLDGIRESDIRNYEPGGITQHVEVTNVPSEVIKSFIGESYKISVPGFVMIDTPGHGAFSVSRRRGGEFADIAVLVIDITNGVQPQTEESLEILRDNKTPFVVALNKIDKLPGWNGSVRDSTDKFKSELRERAYEITGELHNFGFSSDLYDNIGDFSDTVAMVPVSAQNMYGVDTVCSMIVGLTQEFLSGQLEVKEDDDVSGVVLDLTNHQGFGTVVDVLLYEGKICEGDKLFVENSSSKRKVRSILTPQNMGNSRRSSGSFRKTGSITAATFARLALDNTENVQTGDIMSSKEQKTSSDVEDSIEYDDKGVFVCAETTGSLAAIVEHMREENYKVYDGKVGQISKFDVTKVASMQKGYHQVVIGFGADATESAKEFADGEGVKVVTGNVIHQLVDDYEEIYKSERFDDIKSYQNLELPARIKVLDEYIINRSNPAIVGVEVIEGCLEVGSRLTIGLEEYDNIIGIVKRIEIDGDTRKSIDSGQRASLSIGGCTVGRDFETDDVLLSKISEKSARYITKKFDHKASEDVLNLTEEIKDSQQEWYPFWGR
jgi:translation initiation factor 5B